jgi:two-component system NtrC family response regulator
MKTVDRFGNIIGACEAMREIYEQIERISSLEIPVLITGESGTGKELVAQTIHEHSKRYSGPFIPLNMGAISPDLVESELFGHERGSFTGANALKKGKFELGRNGSIFLDEITTMEPKVQVSLLRVLESNQFQRIGGSQFIRTNSRIISATNDDIFGAIKQGTFREDLFYRLNVFSINLPPLRKRKEDILLLAEFFLKKYADEFGKEIASFTPEAQDALLYHPWPGNVRELENAVIKALIMSNDSKPLSEDYLPKKTNGNGGSPSFTIEVGTSFEDMEKRLLKETLRQMKGNKSKTAQVLHISRKALYNKIHYHKIE